MNNEREGGMNKKVGEGRERKNEEKGGNVWELGLNACVP